jgi:hypothetical protein
VKASRGLGFLDKIILEFGSALHKKILGIKQGFLWVIFVLLDPDPQLFNADPDPASQINADPCGSGSETLE